MAFPTFESLNAGERLALPYLEPLIESGLSANEAIQQLREAGLGIRRASALSLIDAIKEQIDAKKYVNSVNLNKALNPERLAQAATKTTGKYSYIVRGTGINTKSGEKATNYVTVISDSLITKQQAMDTAQAIFDTQFDKYEFASGDTVVENVLVSQ